jgi:hypothetical protein
MLMFRRIATEHFAASLANAEMNPTAVNRNTVLAAKYGQTLERNQAMRAFRQWIKSQIN